MKLKHQPMKVMIDKARRAKNVSSILLNKFCTTTIRKEKVPTKQPMTVSAIYSPQIYSPLQPGDLVNVPDLKLGLLRQQHGQADAV